MTDELFSRVACIEIYMEYMCKRSRHSIEVFGRDVN